MQKCYFDKTNFMFSNILSKIILFENSVSITMERISLQISLLFTLFTKIYSSIMHLKDVFFRRLTLIEIFETLALALIKISLL